MTQLPRERRRQLQLLGLRALVKRRHGDAPSEPLPFTGGAALIQGDIAAVFADDVSGLGAAIDIASTASAEHLWFFSEANDGDVARRAGAFALDVSVIDPEGDLVSIEPAPRRPLEDMPPSYGPARARFEDAGLDAVWEHGVLYGEYLGLEVARASDEGIDLGVGRNDRETNRLLYPDGPTDAALASAVTLVASNRRDLSPERWLRAVAMHTPALVGAASLVPIPPPVPRTNLKARSVAPAVSVDGTLYVCSVGVDPDLVPQAADARQRTDQPLVLVLPEGDDHPLTHRLAALLRCPARIVTVPATWRHL